MAGEESATGHTEGDDADVVVIGAGPGGFAAAGVVLKRGARNGAWSGRDLAVAHQRKARPRSFALRKLSWLPASRKIASPST